MDDMNMTSSQLLVANQNAFALRHLSEATQTLRLALHGALVLQDEQKLAEIKQRADEQRQQVLTDPFSNLSWVELNEYSSIIEMANSSLLCA